MSEYVVALSTCPMNVSKEMARILVERKVCACVNIIPKVTSIYHWKDEIIEDDESILIMKTETKQIEPLWKALKKQHQYEVPEFLVLPIEWGSQDYLAWITQNVKNP